MYVTNRLAWMVLRKQRRSLQLERRNVSDGVADKPDGRMRKQPKCTSCSIIYYTLVRTKQPCCIPKRNISVVSSRPAQCVLEIREHGDGHHQRYQADRIASIVDNRRQLNVRIETGHGRLLVLHVGASRVVRVRVPSAVRMAESCRIVCRWRCETVNATGHSNHNSRMCCMYYSTLTRRIVLDATEFGQAL